MKLEEVRADFRQDTGASEPCIVSKDGHTIVLFHAVHNGTYQPGWGVVDCLSVEVLFGGPSDEDIDEHPLSASGLKPYGIFLVHESEWVQRVAKTVASSSEKLQHLIITFHDIIFESIVRSFTISFSQGSANRLYQEVVLPFLVPSGEAFGHA